MLAWHCTAVWLLLASSSLCAQLTIENPKKLNVPESQVQALFVNINHVMESEFHSPGTLQGRFRVRLVLGEQQERFTIDDPDGNGTIYMEHWDEGKFTVSTMRLALQHLMGPDRQKKLLGEIGRRMRETAPITAAQLRKEGAPAPLPPPASIGPDVCVASGIRGGACISIRRPMPSQ